jgi:5-methylcytosine-specific restriction endonuclease McrA
MINAALNPQYTTGPNWEPPPPLPIVRRDPPPPVTPRKRERTPEFRALVTALANKRRARKLQATPAWADEGAIKAIYLEAGRLGMHVDHIVPLQGKNVCGLHVENNLQLLSPTENSKKRNKFECS